MSSIQDIPALELRITDIVEDYINELYDEDDVLAIGLRCGKIILNVDARDASKSAKRRRYILCENLSAWVMTESQNLIVTG